MLSGLCRRRPKGSRSAPFILVLLAQDQEINGTAYLPNPNFGVTSFDNFVHASVIVFQTLFSEGWLQIESYTRATTGPWSVIYWVSLIVVGCFFVVNLAVGVVFASFTRVMEVEQQTMDSKKNGQIASQTDQGSEAAMVRLIPKPWLHAEDGLNVGSAGFLHFLP